MCDLSQALGLSTSAPSPQSTTNDYLKLISGYASGEPTVLATEQQYKPGFVQANLSALGQVQPDYLSLYKANVPGLAGSEAGLNTYTRTANVGDVGAVGPAAASAVRAVNPQQTALTDQLATTTGTQLAAGTQLAPADVRRISSSVQGDWAGRGLGSSAPAQLNVAVDEATQGQNVLAQREAAAQAAIGQQQQDITAPALALSTTTSDIPGQASSLLTQEAAYAGGAGPTLLPGQQQYDIFNTTYNAQAAAKIAGANNNAAVLGSLLSY